MANGSINLPPGFLFSPTDEELVLHFLYYKVSLLPCHPNIIPELDLSLLDPWKLNGMVQFSVQFFEIIYMYMSENLVNYSKSNFKRFTPNPNFS